MPETTNEPDLRDRTLVDRDGEKIGKIDELYYDEQGGQPEWALVNTGLFGTKKTFVPIKGVKSAGEDLQVPVTKAQVKSAPRIDANQELSEPEERQLFEHYGVPYTTEGSTTAQGQPQTGRMQGREQTGRAQDREQTGRTQGREQTGRTQGREQTGRAQGSRADRPRARSRPGRPRRGDDALRRGAACRHDSA